MDECRQFMGRRRFYLVTVPESEDPACDEFAEVGPLVARLTELVGRKVYAFVFCGERWQLTRPPYRHLLRPDGSAVPLYMPPTGQLEVDPAGDMDDPPAAAGLPDGAGGPPAGGRPGLTI